MTPVTLLILASTALALGIMLAWWGRRGKIIDDHPVCRKCRFDLVGRPPGSDRCPECGADLSGKRAIAIGNRKPRQSAVVIGCCIAMFVVFSFAGLGGSRYLKEDHKPNWLVLIDARSKNARIRSAALAELWDRQQMGQLSESQSNAYVDCILAIGFSVDDNGRSEMMDDMIVVCLSNQRAIQALVADLRIPDSPDPKHPYILHSYPLKPPRTIGEYAAEILIDSDQPAWDAMRQEARKGDPWVLKHWLEMGGYARGGLLDERLAKLMLESTSSKDQVLSERASGSIFQMAQDSITFPSGPALAGLTDPHPEIRLASLCLLGDLDKPPSLDVLLPLLHDQNSDVRLRAETELTSCYKWTSDNRAVAPLIAIFYDPKSTLRREAADGLSHFKTPGSIRALALALKDEDGAIVADAMVALESIGGEAAFEAVIDVLDDGPEDHRVWVESLADRLCKGSYKSTPYWQKHESAKLVGTKATSTNLQNAQP